MRISDWSSDVCSSDLFAWCQQGAGGLLPADHDVREPWREPVARIVAHGALFGGGAEGIGDALRRPLVLCREGHADMAVVEDRVVLAILLLDLVQALCDQGEIGRASCRESVCQYW